MFVIPGSFETGGLIAEGTLKMEVEQAILDKAAIEEKKGENKSEFKQIFFKSVSVDNQEKERLLKMKNKDFIYYCLNILISHDRKDDIEKLTDAFFCKRKFDMNFPILQEVPRYGSIPERDFMDSTLNRRCYPEPIVVCDKRYIVCNDWYYKTKSNSRDTRTHFVNWVLAG